jgi:hypothetical protein
MIRHHLTNAFLLMTAFGCFALVIAIITSVR